MPQLEVEFLAGKVANLESMVSVCCTTLNIENAAGITLVQKPFSPK